MTDSLRDIIEREPRSIDWRGSPKVIFENCVFENCSRAGVLVGNDGDAVLLNCTIRDCEKGCWVAEGGRLTAEHCRIMCAFTACQVSEKARSLDLLRCVAGSCAQDVVNIAWCGKVLIQGCRLENCTDHGIMVQGRLKHINTVQVTDCTITGCRIGVALYSGEFRASLTICTVSSNGLGLFLNELVLGTVHVTSCICEDNERGFVRKVCRDRCVLMIDGVQQSFVQLNPNRVHIALDLNLQRALKRAGVSNVFCMKCAKVEPHNEEFKNCSRYKKVCYCSKECQKADWRNHKEDCSSIL